MAAARQTRVVEDGVADNGVTGSPLRRRRHDQPAAGTDARVGELGGVHHGQPAQEAAGAHPHCLTGEPIAVPDPVLFVHAVCDACERMGVRDMVALVDGGSGGGLLNDGARADAAALVVHAAEFEDEDDVLVLMLTSEHTAAVKTLNPSIRLVKRDATVESKLTEQFATRAFPTLKFFKVGVDAVKDYDGGRTSDENEKLAVMKSGRAVKIVESAKELEKTSEANDVAVFVVVDADKGESHTLLQKLGDTDDQAVYVAHQQGRDGGRRRGQQGGAVYEGRRGQGHLRRELEEVLGELVQPTSLPLIIAFTQEKAPN
ncbi:hypothetical protein PR003_g1905 [Phytophthora rubi]|uniref:Thioredoxin domain-containing protein n=1 Tax=Phytophthora rubi TaxID=129364 RepID=A0A6A4G2E9_9STRA|nr:hypothetical protein PR002_g1766 [Phytophthora rubi]KAE9051197.1 hypothetical protein PR001_g1684 [Phytophthora rubi]KAE9357238.1 hypothetical protein PR003_g1905 [Phytophthora rubi]